MQCRFRMLVTVQGSQQEDFTTCQSHDAKFIAGELRVLSLAGHQAALLLLYPRARSLNVLLTMRLSQRD